MNKNAPVEHETAEQSSPAVHTIHQEEFMALAMRQMNPEADITEKLTEKHIDKMLDNDRLQIQEKRVSVREQGIMRIILIRRSPFPKAVRSCCALARTAISCGVCR